MSTRLAVQNPKLLFRWVSRVLVAREPRAREWGQLELTLVLASDAGAEGPGRYPIKASYEQNNDVMMRRRQRYKNIVIRDKRQWVQEFEWSCIADSSSAMEGVRAEDASQG